MYYLNFFIKNFMTFCDAAEAWQLGVQDPATPAMEGMLLFHQYLMFYLILIGVFVFWILFYVLSQFNSKINEYTNIFTHSSILEIVWTILPAILLVFIAIPSFSLLYSTEELTSPSLTLKVIGHQWYWSYEFSDYVDKNYNVDTINYDSYMVTTDDLTKGSFRLLEVDNRVVLPTNTHIRVLVTSADVLHSWAVPSFGFKVDACPGRLSQGALFIKRSGVFYGQCSEICGVNHGFMPIVIKAVKPETFFKWIQKKSEPTLPLKLTNTL